MPFRRRNDFDGSITLGPVRLRSPLIGASGTVGDVVDFARVADLKYYGAMTAKSVSYHPRPGRPEPRLAAVGEGMLNGVGVQNPGIEKWAEKFGPQIPHLPVPVWGSAAGSTPQEFADTAEGLQEAGVAAVEINLSCPNWEGKPPALDPAETARIVSAVRAAVSSPIGAKLSPDDPNIAETARAATAMGADWLTLTNTIPGSAVDAETGRSRLSGPTGGYSGPPLKPLAMRCVLEVSRALPEVPIVGCGGAAGAADVVEYLAAGAGAVAVGTAHFYSPRIARRIYRDLARWCSDRGITAVSQLTGRYRAAAPIDGAST